MKVRYGLAALFVGVVAALIVVRDLGYLGGRTNGGPLRIGTTYVNGPPAGFGLMPTLEGDPVEIQSARPRFISPGGRYRAARLLADGRCGNCDYPRTGPLFVGSDYDGEDEVVFGLRADKPGVYYALDFRVDYKRGLRRFRAEADQVVCTQVGFDVPCGKPVDPGDAPLAEMGGPSDYGVRVEDGVAGLPAEGGPVRLPLVNRTGRTIEVSGIDAATPPTFRLRPGAGRTIRLDLDTCPEVPLRELTARVDGDRVDVPLTVALGCA